MRGGMPVVYDNDFCSPEGAAPGGAVCKLPATASLEEIRQVFDRDGIVVLTDAVSGDTLKQINDALDPLFAEQPLGCTHGVDEDMVLMHGANTKRLNNTLQQVPLLAEAFVANPKVLEVARSVLTRHSETILIQQAQAFEGHPGQEAQPLHRDDALWPIEGKRFPMSIMGAFALGEYTPEVGSTQAILGSHRWPEALSFEPSEDEHGWLAYSLAEAESHEISAVDMPAGSVALWYGSLLHGGGANVSADRIRRGFIMSYCLGWLRGELNPWLMWPPAVAKGFPEEVQRLMGYQMESAIIGGLEMSQDPICLLKD